MRVCACVCVCERERGQPTCAGAVYVLMSRIMAESKCRKQEDEGSYIPLTTPTSITVTLILPSPLSLCCCPSVSLSSSLSIQFKGNFISTKVSTTLLPKHLVQTQGHDTTNSTMNTFTLSIYTVHLVVLQMCPVCFSQEYI